jgi:hypothetical protein
MWVFISPGLDCIINLIKTALNNTAKKDCNSPDHTKSELLTVSNPPEKYAIVYFAPPQQYNKVIDSDQLSHVVVYE